MKRTGLLILLIMFILGLSTQAFALLKFEGIYSVYAKNQGVGAGVEIPLIPLFPITLYASKLNDKNITLPNVTYKGDSFNGEVKFQSIAGELQIKTPIDLFGVKLGATVMADLLSGKNVSGKMVTLPGNIYAGIFGQYGQSLLPFLDWYLQAGLLNKIVNGEKAINDEIHKSSPGTSVNLKDIDQSGLYARAGLSLGF